MLSRSGMSVPFSLIALAALCAGLPGRAAAGVYDDCAAWYHLDYAPTYDPTTNNVAKLDEIRDQRDWGTAALKGAGGKHATAIHGPLGGPQWTNCPVACPAGGQKYGAYSMLFQPMTNGLGQTLPDCFQVPTLKLPGSSSIVTRFLWNGFTYSSSYPGWIMNNSLDWNARSGWMFGVRGDGGNRLGMYVGQTAFYLDTYTVVTGKWYDAAAVLTDNGTNDTVELYIWPQDGSLTYKKFFTSAVTNAIGSSGAVIGSEPYVDTYGYATNSNSGKAFSGIVNHLAVWNRALSNGEVAEAFCYPQPLFQIGLNNNSTNELRGASETDAEYFPGDPWHTMRNAVTATERDTTLKIPLTSIQSKLDTVFHVETATDGSQTAALSLIVNTATNASQTAGANKDLYWLITADKLVTGTNTFTLHYETGPSALISFDWMELGGSWQIGTNDNNQSEFAQESPSIADDYYVTDPNWKHLERSIMPGETNNIIHFTLSAELARRYCFTYTTRVIAQGPSALTNYAFSVGVNNLYTQSYPPQANGTLITLPINRSVIKAGENTIHLMYNGPSSMAEGGGWVQFDFHRLEIAPMGTLFLMN